MRKLLLLIFVASFSAAHAQVDTTRELQKNNTRGFAFKTVGADSALLLPLDTFKLKSTWRGMAFKGDTPYYWDGSKWKANGGANIYNSDGTLTGDRTLTGAGYGLDLQTDDGSGLTYISMWPGEIWQDVTKYGVERNNRIKINDSIEMRSYYAGNGYMSDILIKETGITLRPNLGRITIDSVSSGATTDSLLTWNASTGRTGKIPIQSLAMPIRTATSNVTFGSGDYTVIVTGGTPSVTLPAAASYTGRIFRIVNQTASGLSCSSYIDNTGATATTVPAYGLKTFQSNGTNWYLIGQ